MRQIIGAELFVKALKEEAVDTLFAYPGGQAIDLFNALYGEKEIDVILPRHEQGLIHAASTGKVGVYLVTSGPGATNLVTGIATANYDSVPLVCFTGQVPTHLIGNDTFQEVDFVGITRSICKYAVMVRKREDLAETIKKAFYIAKTGKPGVVVVDLPKDVQRAYGSDFYPKEISTGTRFNERITGKTEEFAVNAKIIHIGENDQMLTSGGLETMGYGFPAAIGAKLGNPHKDVIVISGDGGMQMNIQEMATAVVYELPVIICVLNNGYLGNLRRWQEMFYERRYSSTCMRYRRSCEIVRGGNVMILCIKFVEGG